MEQTLSDDPLVVRSALKEAHLPSLLMSPVHITGDGSLLSEDMRPRYAAYVDQRPGGLSTTGRKLYSQTWKISS